MSNYNLEDKRNNEIDKLPRINYLPPSPQDNPQSNTQPIQFCQTGCNLTFKFEDISNCRFENTGTYAILSPPNNQKNYIEWNGSDINGQEEIKFFLKEILFGLPAKDKAVTDILNRTIQYYFTYVNSSYPNLMLVVSVIGQVNNTGNEVKTNGYRLMETLAPTIPLSPGLYQNLSNLSKFNVGSLIPAKKTFYQSLVESSNIQYILMQQIVDVPLIFFNNLVTRVLGAGKYAKINEEYNLNPPRNPANYLIFYNEATQPMGVDDGLVCDTSCNQVPSNAVQPSVGQAASGGASRRIRRVGAARQEEEFDIPRMQIPAVEEICFSEEGVAGTSVKVGKAGIVIEEARTSIIIQIIFSLVGNILFVGIIFAALYLLFGLDKIEGSTMKKFFSSLFWNMASKKGWLIFGIITNLLVTLFFSLSIGYAAKSLAEIDSDTPKEDKANNTYWVFMLVGCIIFFISLVIIMYNYFKTRGGIASASNVNLNKLYSQNYYGATPSAPSQNSVSISSLPQAANLSKKIDLSKIREYILTNKVKNSIIKLSNKFPSNPNLQILKPVAMQQKAILNRRQFDALVDVAATKKF